jgi:hypothetical protein
MTISTNISIDFGKESGATSPQEAIVFTVTNLAMKIRPSRPINLSLTYFPDQYSPY